MTQNRQHSLAVALWMGAVLAGCSLALFGVTALAPRIAPSLGFTPESVGLFSGAAWSAGLLVSMVSASLVLKYGAWPVARLCVLTCAVGVLCIAVGHPAFFWIGAVLIGIGQGLEPPPASQLLVQHVPIKTRPFYFSLKQMGVQLGAIIASLSLPVITLFASWQVALIVLSTMLMVLAVGLGYPARRYHRAQDVSLQTARPGVSWRGLVTWVAVLREDRRLMRLATAAAAFGATQVCLNTFLVTWMVTVREVSLTSAGLLAATAQGAGLVGRPLWGWVASHGATSRRVLLYLGICMSACSALLGISGASLPTAVLFVLAAVFGLSASGWNGLFLSEVASGLADDRVAAGTASAMVPVFVGLIIGPISFAVVARWFDLSAGFLMLSGLALGGTAVIFSMRNIRK